MLMVDSWSLTSVILTMSMKASSGSGQDSCSHRWQTGWMQATRSTAEELCLMGTAPACRGCSWDGGREIHHRNMIVDETQHVYHKTNAAESKCYLVNLHSPLHPVLGGTECLVQPVGQRLAEALLKVNQLKYSPEKTANTSVNVTIRLPANPIESCADTECNNITS